MQLEKIKTIIVDIAQPQTTTEELDHRMGELESLVSTYGGVTIIKKIQRKTVPDYRTFIGSGKLDEIIALGDELGAELLIIGNIMKPAQIWNVNEILRKKKSKMQAWDRVDLILKIFALHAVSPESKLQIELAAIKHMGPRIFGMGMELSRQGGGSKNAKGQGETNTEIMKRHLREKEDFIREKLKTYERTRSLHRAHRKRKNLATVGIVGYTNAGKSTFFNLLTQKGVLAQDKLFATLGTSVGKVYIDRPCNNSFKNDCSEAFPYACGVEILLNDTIGFIQDLPPDLIAAFRSTLEDSLEADILLHVVDANDPWIQEKIDIVNDTLDRIGASQERFLIYNKIDLLSTDQRQELLTRQNLLISSVTGEGIEDIKKFLYNTFVKHKNID
ncbi:GTPase HflX [Candidatus Gracilibacteria bacterium]|nr:GTPase HflX [Candidatus Gracilibacteria bacterium]